MDNPIAKYLTKDAHDDEKIMDQLAYNEKMAELGRLSAGVIHEINTPLSVIAAASQMVLQERDLSEFAVEMIERIHEEAQRLSRLTRGLLSFSREDEGVVEETDVNETLREVMGFLKYEAQKRSVGVEEDFDYQLPGIFADANRLKQVFINIVMNALQAMPQGGRLLLRSSLSEGQTIRIDIIDTGPGMSPELIDKIFDPFYTTKKPGQGTGLGLFVTRNNVLALGGRIEVESREGEGARFTLHFPVCVPS
jgi:signal transduction histidine kinase